MSEKKNTPAIRFAGFTDAWEQRKVGDLTEELTEYTTLVSDFPLLTSSRSGLMYQNEYRGNLTTDSSDTLFSVVPFGACTYRHMSDDDVFHLNINTLEKGLVSREYPVFIATKENDLDFIVQFINSNDSFRSFCAEQKKGGTRTRLYYKTLCEFKIMVPHKAEQRQISKVLLNIDSLITLHQRKYDALVKVKKAMLGKMFPKGDSKLPEIRFAGFTDAWEQHKCGDVLIERNIQHPQNDEYPLVSFTVENGVTPKTERYEREQLVSGDAKAKKYKETHLDDIVYNPANLKFGAIARNKYGNAVFSPIYVTYEVDKTKASPSFVEMYVTQGEFIQNALQYQQGTVYERMSVSTEAFAQLDIMLPSKDEQSCIGGFFANLDDLIILHQRELEKLKNFKKALLKKMFV